MEKHSIVDHVAGLARIAISQEEKAFLDGQLARIIEYIGQLNAVDIEEAAPLRGLHPQKNVFRSDEVHPFPAAKEILNNCPASEENYFKIPKVIE
jgi:aspartyl-tRNA(Asn)/glutamyl-tRNA(Gln) amidotransferase subunit C